MGEHALLRARIPGREGWILYLIYNYNFILSIDSIITIIIIANIRFLFIFSFLQGTRTAMTL